MPLKLCYYIVGVTKAEQSRNKKTLFTDKNSGGRVLSGKPLGSRSKLRSTVANCLAPKPFTSLSTAPEIPLCITLGFGSWRVFSPRAPKAIA